MAPLQFKAEEQDWNCLETWEISSLHDHHATQQMILSVAQEVLLQLKIKEVRIGTLSPELEEASRGNVDEATVHQLIDHLAAHHVDILVSVAYSLGFHVPSKAIHNFYLVLQLVFQSLYVDEL